MWIYLGIAVICAAIVPWARRRSNGSMTTYSIRTGAPVVMVLFAVSALGAAWAAGSGDADLAREVFTGGLIGGALAQFILMRRTYGIRLEDHPAPAITKARDAANNAEPDTTDPDDAGAEPPRGDATDDVSAGIDARTGDAASAGETESTSPTTSHRPSDAPTA